MDSIKYLVRVQIITDKCFFGTGIADLLLLVDETHSLHKACEKMNMAYSKGWKIIKFAEKKLGFALLSSKVGGLNGGGSIITQSGREFLKCYLDFKEELKESSDILFRKHFNNYL